MINVQEYLDENYPKSERSKIKKLDIKNKNLEDSLDLSDFVNLEEINCGHNELTHLRLNDLNNLKKITCSNNELINLSVNNCLNINWINSGNNLFASLDFLNNLDPKKITWLDISYNKFPEQDLNLFKNFTNLEKLFLDGNNFFGSLKPLKDLSKLKYLSIQKTDIEEGLVYLSASLQKIRCLEDGGKKCSKIKAELGEFAEEGDAEGDIITIFKDGTTSPSTGWHPIAPWRNNVPFHKKEQEQKKFEFGKLQKDNSQKEKQLENEKKSNNVRLKQHNRFALLGTLVTASATYYYGSKSSNSVNQTAIANVGFSAPELSPFTCPNWNYLVGLEKVNQNNQEQIYFLEQEISKKNWIISKKKSQLETFLGKYTRSRNNYQIKIVQVEEINERKINSLNEIIASKNNEIIDLEENKQSLQKKNEELQKKLEQKNLDYHSLNNQLKVNDLNTIEKFLTNLRDEEKKLSIETLIVYKNSPNRLSQLMKENQELKSKLGISEVKKDDLQFELERKKANITAKDEEIKKLKESKKDLQKEIMRLDEELRKLRENADENKDRIEDLESEKNRLERKLEKTEKNLETVKKEKKDLEENVFQLKQGIDLKAENKQIKFVNKEKVELKKENNYLINIVGVSAVGIASHLATKKIYQDKKDEELKEKKENELTQLQTSHNNLKIQQAELEKQSQHLIEQVKQTKQEKDTLLNEKQTTEQILRKELNSLEEKNINLGQRVTNLENETIEQKNLLALKNEELIQQQTQLDKLQEKKQELEDKISNLQKEIPPSNLSALFISESEKTEVESFLKNYLELLKEEKKSLKHFVTDFIDSENNDSEEKKEIQKQQSDLETKIEVIKPYLSKIGTWGNK